jgi:hypothetical protein
MKVKVIALSSLLAACFCLSALGVDKKAEKDWQSAVKSNSVFAYQQFLKKHPLSEFTEQARQRLAEFEEIKLAEAEKADSWTAYYSFLTDYPQSGHKDKVVRKLRLAIAGVVAEVVKKQLGSARTIRSGQELISLRSKEAGFLVQVMIDFAKKGKGSLSINTESGLLLIEILGDPTDPIILEVKSTGKQGSYQVVYQSGVGAIMLGNGWICMNLEGELSNAGIESQPLQ